MKGNNQKTKEIFDRYLSGEATEKENFAVESWYQSLADEPMVLDEDQAELDMQRLLFNMRRQIRKDKVRSYYRVAAVAASLLIPIIFFTTRYLTKRDQHIYPSVVAVEGKKDSSSGYGGATLTFADNSRIALNHAERGIVVKDKISYEDGTVVPNVGQRAADLMLLSTQRGGQYRITLSDGTKVFLNAGSALKYPSQFSGQERRVELTGEAFFEVHSDPAHPFIVSAKGQEVKVLGTIFNINAYLDDEAVTTTLAEGSIMLKSAHDDGRSVILKPNEQSTSEGGKITVRKVDVQAAIAWTQDLFYFSNTDLKTVLIQLQRWYDIEIDWTNMPTNKRLFCQIPRSTPLENVLKAIEMTSNVKFKLSERRLSIERR
ncbi:FecR family protein [Sphingobacterium spiritivorum]|uniref:FecR family protein n=1 Tax=Sphingobacterium spiritivorum TaxID=258 RepID=UPI003DA2FDBB